MNAVLLKVAIEIEISLFGCCRRQQPVAKTSDTDRKSSLFGIVRTGTRVARVGTLKLIKYYFMKPQPKGRSSDSTDQSIRQHEAGSCYDFTKLSEALHLAHNSLDNEVVYHCSNSIVMENESASRSYDFGEMSEALSNCEDEDSNSLAFRQALLIKLGRPSFLKTREKMIRSEPLKVRKVKLVNVKTGTGKVPTMYNLTLRSLRKCS